MIWGLMQASAIAAVGRKPKRQSLAARGGTKSGAGARQAVCDCDRLAVNTQEGHYFSTQQATLNSQQPRCLSSRSHLLLESACTY
jgi:hypothetical protein